MLNEFDSGGGADELKHAREVQGFTSLVTRVTSLYYRRVMYESVTARPFLNAAQVRPVHDTILFAG